ncbi:hypothetical protein PPUJ20028_08680 [Pseudomonas putida]|uniref:Uncharacterized protein n=1 Tax=Pseudomonas putida TaxID=303 RepID=A0AA37VVK3_PSEPU|nr:hypothetical protein PPUJ20028_08680 [Pseudomonas putida]GLO35330.1 hypothetical protein PPUN14671_21630 [Pseudomonas putida]
MSKNPAELVELPGRPKKEIDPFTQAQANTIINTLYQHKHWPSLIYAALYEFMFFTGLRLPEALAVRGSPQRWQRSGDRSPVPIPAVEERRVRKTDLRPTQTVDAGAE